MLRRARMTRTSTQPRQEHSADDSVQPAGRGTAPVVTAEGRLRRVRRLANHIVPRQVAPCAAESPPQPAAEGWRPALAHGFIPYTVTEADHRQFAERGYLVLPPVLDCAALDALVHDVQSHWDAAKGAHNANEGTWLQAGLLPNIHHLSERCRDLYLTTPANFIASLSVSLSLCLALCLSVSVSVSLCVSLTPCRCAAYITHGAQVLARAGR